jgi:hypothetical protein
MFRDSGGRESRRVVGEEVLKPCREIKQLRQGGGNFAPLTHNGYFEQHPHLITEGGTMTRRYFFQTLLRLVRSPKVS